MADIQSSIEKLLQTSLGTSLTLKKMQPIGGGCINNAAKAQTSDGDFFIKWNQASFHDAFKAEAEGLKAIREAVDGQLVVPQIIGLSQPQSDMAIIIMEMLETSSSAKAQWENLGRGLAKMHLCVKEQFGFPYQTFCGSTPLKNKWQEHWAEFYRDQRIGSLLQSIRKTRGLNSAQNQKFDRLCQNIPEILGHSPKASLLHGDLWQGNYLTTSRGPAIIDPAVFFGDREFEFSIMFMFGGFPHQVLDAYQEVSPLPDVWEQRQDLYQLFHILNHYLIFGGSYLGQALRITEKLI